MSKRELVQSLSGEYPVRLLCRVVNLAPSTYYYCSRERDDLSLLSLIEGVLIRFPTYGYRRVAAQLRREGEAINHKRVLRVMRENDLIEGLRRPRTRTTNSKHGYRRYPNLLRKAVIDHPDQIWCADITYIRLHRYFVYLAVILDIFTRSIRGWHLGHSLSSDLALTALDKALLLGRPEVHHSDQGIQYAATEYVKRLRAVNVQLSMSAKGQPTENPYAERVIRTIKEEEVYLNEYDDFADAYERVGHFIEEVYQTKRIHSALGYLTPVEFEAQQRDGLMA